MKILKSWESREWLQVMVALFAVSLALYYAPLSGRTIFAGPDTLAPTAVKAGLEALQDSTGETPIWLPMVFSGMPVVHSVTSVSHLYFPVIISRILSALGLPGFWFFILHLIFAGMGCYFLARHLRLTFAASLLAGLGFILMPYLNTMLVHGHGSQMMTLAYLPWVIYAQQRLFDRGTFAAAALLALLVGLQLQRGHAQIAYYTLMMAGLLFLVQVVRSWRDPEYSTTRTVRFVLLFGAAMAVGLALAAALLIPLQSYIDYSIRGGRAGGSTGFDYATMWSFSFGETMTFLLPSFYGFGGVTYWGGMPFTDYPNYMGIILLALAVWAVAVKRTWLTWTLAGAGFLAYLISLGHNFFLYRVFFNVMPYFNKFRVPVMILVLTQFAVVILAGIGLDSLLERLKGLKPEPRRRHLLYAAGGVAALTAIFLVLPEILAGNLPAPRGVSAQAAGQVNQLRLDMIRADAVWFLVIAGGAVALIYLWLAEILSRRWMLACLMLVVVVDLGRIDRAIIQPSPGSYRPSLLNPRAMITRYLSSDKVTDFLTADQGKYRILPLGALQNENRWSAFGIESVAGYHPAKLANYDRFIQTTGFRSSGILRMLNVKYLVSQQRFSDPRFEEVFVDNLYSGGRYQPAVVYRYTGFLERAWFPGRVVVVASEPEIIQKLLLPSYDPRVEVFVPAEQWSDSLTGGTARVVETFWQPNYIRLAVEAEEWAFLALSEVYYPMGWVARIDGEPTQIYPVNTILRGIMVPAGRHSVTFDFEPSDLRLGRWITQLALLVVILGFVPAVVVWVRERR